MRTLICGYYGHSNTGDELILKKIISDVTSIRPDATITVVSTRPDMIEQAHKVDAVSEVEDIISVAAKADLMILGGGGLFQDYGGANAASLLLPGQSGLAFYAGFALLARTLGVPLAIHAVGVGPLNTTEGRELTRAAFEAATTATVRDPASLQLLADIGCDVARIKVTADPGFAVAAPDPSLPGKAVGFFLRSWGDNTWLPAVTRAIDKLVASGQRVELVPMQGPDSDHENDLTLAEAVAAEVGSNLITIAEAPTTGEDLVQTAAHYRAIVAMRLHGLVAGAVSGRPVVALAYDPKVSRQMEALGGTSLDLESLTSEELTQAIGTATADPDMGGRLQEAAKALAVQEDGNRQALQRALTRSKRQSEPYADLLINRAGLQREVAASHQRIRDLLTEIDSIRQTATRLQEENSRLWQSKAVRLSSLWWRLRSRRSAS